MSVRLDSKLVRDKSGAPWLMHTNLLFHYQSLGQRARGLVHESTCEFPLQLLFAHIFYIVPTFISPNMTPSPAGRISTTMLVFSKRAIMLSPSFSQRRHVCGRFWRTCVSLSNRCDERDNLLQPCLMQPSPSSFGSHNNGLLTHDHD